MASIKLNDLGYGQTFASLSSSGQEQVMGGDASLIPNLENLRPFLESEAGKGLIDAAKATDNPNVTNALKGAISAGLRGEPIVFQGIVVA
jgi:hypothetical protein